MKKFVVIFFKRHIIKNAVKISVAVGTLLNFTNQGSEIIAGVDISWSQIALNFFIPYCVASYSAAKNEIRRSNVNGSN